MNSATTWPCRIGVAFLLSFIVFGSSALAQEGVAATSALRVGVSPVFPPMVFKQGGQLVGVEVDLARALGENLGRKITFVELPWEEQIEALRAGRTDIIMSSMSITTARKYVLDFSKPYLLVGQLSLVRREDKNQYLLGLPPMLACPVGVLKATTGEFLVQREYPKAKLKVFKSEEEVAKALMKKKIDLFIGDSTLVWYLAGIHATDGLAVVPIPLSEEALAWGVRKGDDKLRTSADQFLQKASGDGTLNRIFRRWTAVSP
jgi:ABC-type amino acid transport substrate-binding protein